MYKSNSSFQIISNNSPQYFDGVKTEALETALDYIGRGWSPIPVGHQKKKPKLEGWPTLRLGAEDAGRYFNGAAQNIGVILGPASGGLTDVDLDCSEAVGLGSYFLPPTDAIFGRASKRNSHFLYFTGITASDDRATIQFKDPKLPQDNKNMLLEVRIGGGGKGAQSIFPGSTHEEGEEIRWETNGVPAKVEDADLTKAARWLATASLFIRYMPGSGSRHGAFCAIGGFLARCGLTGPEVKLFAEAITAAGDFARDHIGHATSAAEAHYSGKHSYGYKTIAEVFGEKVATKAAEWLGYRSGSNEENDGAARRGPSQTDILLELAQSAELFHSSDGTGFADLHINGHRETWRLRAKDFRRWLARCFFEKTRGAPSSEALQTALNVIEARAHFDAPERLVYIRVGGFEGKLYLDLGDEAWRAVEIDATATSGDISKKVRDIDYVRPRLGDAPDKHF